MRLESLVQDLRYGWRQLRKTPALVAAIVLSLAVGLGANTAIFSLIDAAILRPLPVQDPGSLLLVEWTAPGFPPGLENINGSYRTIAAGRSQGSSVSARLHRALAREQTGFAALVGIADPDAIALAVDTAPAEQVTLQYVSGPFFQGIGAAPVLGRPFGDEDDRVGQEPVVIVSHRFWQRRLGGNAQALDRTVRVNNVLARVVGVAPPGFFGLRAGQWTDVYAPLAMRVAFRPELAPAMLRSENDRDWWVRQVARLRPDVPERVAVAQADSLFRRLATPEGAAVDPATLPSLVTMTARTGLSALGRQDTQALWILLLLVAVLLIIVCANVANLLLSRSVGRHHESAVRLALGATRARLFRQHLIESGLLAILGGAAGIGLGYVLAQAIHRLFQAGRDASSAFDLHVDVRVLGYSAALTLLTALVFGLAPALRAAHAALGEALKSQSRSVIGGRLRLPRLLVSIQIALSLAALVAAGLLGRTLENLQRIDVGVDAAHVAYASVNPARAGYAPERIPPYIDRVRDEIARLPGVASVSVSSFRALSGMGNNVGVFFPDRARTDVGRANLNTVGVGFFETLRIPLVAGRTFDTGDMGSESGAAVVDEAFARRHFPNQDPLGRRIGDEQNPSRYEIVGVVGNSRYNNLRDDPYPTLYRPYRPGGAINFVVRTQSAGPPSAEAVRRAVAVVDPTVPVTEFHTQSGLIDRFLRTERLLGFVSGAFGVVALTLAGLGLAGLLAYAVARRTNEIGVRMALGAARADVIRLVLRDSISMLAVGTLIGLPCAYAVARVLQTSLFRLDPWDPAIAGAAIVMMTTAALVAAWIPARRAAGIDPITALRQE